MSGSRRLYLFERAVRDPTGFRHFITTASPQVAESPQYPIASPSLRTSDPPMSTPVRGSIRMP
jgi:hypothetical protein